MNWSFTLKLFTFVFLVLTLSFFIYFSVFSLYVGAFISLFLFLLLSYFMLKYPLIKGFSESNLLLNILLRGYILILLVSFLILGGNTFTIAVITLLLFSEFYKFNKGRLITSKK